MVSRPAGACCLPEGACQILDGEFCAGEGGAYNGDDTICEAVDCTPPTTMAPTTTMAPVTTTMAP
ncbi:MAG: hypothetical protein E4H03_05910, partial [Myxococcales bacterium]